MQHLIIGAGPAGVVAAETLRKADPDAAIAIIGDEPEPPYSRMAIPYYLINDIDETGTYLRDPKQHFGDLNIEVVQQRVDKIDTQGNLPFPEDPIEDAQFIIASFLGPEFDQP